MRAHWLGVVAVPPCIGWRQSAEISCYGVISRSIALLPLAQRSQQSTAHPHCTVTTGRYRHYSRAVGVSRRRAMQARDGVGPRSRHRVARSHGVQRRCLWRSGLRLRTAGWSSVHPADCRIMQTIRLSSSGLFLATRNTALISLSFTGTVPRNSHTLHSIGVR